MPLKRVRIRDVCNMWIGMELDVPDKRLTNEECVCSIPYWVHSVTFEGLETEDDHNWKPLRAIRTYMGSNSSDTGHDVFICVGENRIWVDTSRADSVWQTALDTALDEPTKFEPILLHVIRAEPLKRFFPRLSPFEVARFSIAIFIIGF